jgi:hypothetical protein
MKYGFVLPGGSAADQLEQAVLADRAGWDAVFVWESGYAVDAWSLLTAMAVKTEKVRLGTMLTPLPWRRPWKLAGQVATLDQLSNGRAILAVGLGAPGEELGLWGEETDRKTRAELLDEGLDVITKLWAGEPRYEGKHYNYDTSKRVVGGGLRTVQQPRVPIWVVGAWPRPKSMNRILRYDGILPNCQDEEGNFRETKPKDATDIKAWIEERQPGSTMIDIIAEGETPPDPKEAAAIVKPWADAGATWWLDARWGIPEGTDPIAVVNERLEAGPPGGGKS